LKHTIRQNSRRASSQKSIKCKHHYHTLVAAAVAAAV
jgi:hypothetical protein